MPVAFLRDLFVCIMPAPLLLPLLANRSGAVALVALAVLFALFAPPGLPLVRPLILPFFLAGAALRVHGVDTGRVLIVPAALIMAVAIAAAIFVIDGQSVPGAAAGHFLTPTAAAKSMLLRLTVAYLFWCLALRLSASRWGHRLRRIEPYVFFVFCSHVIIIKLIAVPGSWIIGGY